MNLMKQDNGQKVCAAAFIDVIESGTASPIPIDALVEVTQVTFDIVDMLEKTSLGNRVIVVLSCRYALIKLSTLLHLGASTSGRDYVCSI